MAQFPMGGFFNRQQQNYPHGGQFQQFPQMPGHGAMGNMQRPMTMPNFGPGFGPANQNFHPQQNVPRGTFPPNFGANRGRPPQMPGNMPPQMPPQQNMPPMHLLNPTNDPNVKFEPIPGGMMPPGGAPNPGPVQMPQTMPPMPPTANVGEIATKLSDFAQGESNSIIFYENLLKVTGISENGKGLILELLNNKRGQLQNIVKLYGDLTKTEWSAKNMRIEQTKNFRADIKYALLQESRLLREATYVHANLDDAAHQKIMNMVLHNKVADIAHLMAL